MEHIWIDEHGGPFDPEPCDKVVAVLGQDETYPCVLMYGHDGRCEPDYHAGS